MLNEPRQYAVGRKEVPLCIAWKAFISASNFAAAILSGICEELSCEFGGMEGSKRGKQSRLKEEAASRERRREALESGGLRCGGCKSHAPRQHINSTLRRSKAGLRGHNSTCPSAVIVDRSIRNFLSPVKAINRLIPRTMTLPQDVAQKVC